MNIYDQILEKIQVKPGTIKQAEEKLESLIKKLEQLGDVIVNGSFATGTMIKKRRGEDENIDLDLILVCENSLSAPKAKEKLVDILGDRVKQVVEKGKKVITLKYADDSSVDILPVIKSNIEGVFIKTDKQKTAPKGLINVIKNNANMDYCNISGVESSKTYVENETTFGKYLKITKKLKKDFENDEDIRSEGRFGSIVLTKLCLDIFNDNDSYTIFLKKLIQKTEEKINNNFRGIINPCFEEEIFNNKIKNNKEQQESLESFGEELSNILETIEEKGEEKTLRGLFGLGEGKNSFVANTSGAAIDK